MRDGQGLVRSQVELRCRARLCGLLGRLQHAQQRLQKISSVATAKQSAAGADRVGEPAPVAGDRAIATRDALECDQAERLRPPGRYEHDAVPIQQLGHLLGRLRACEADMVIHAELRLPLQSLALQTLADNSQALGVPGAMQVGQRLERQIAPLVRYQTPNEDQSAPFAERLEMKHPRANTLFSKAAIMVT